MRFLFQATTAWPYEIWVYCCNSESFVSGQICFHFFFLRSPGIAFMRISEMGAAMFIMHVDRHFPIWTTYSCSFRQTCPKKSEKIPYTQIFTWKFPWWSCAGVFECLKTYIISACTGGKHRSPYLCINLFAAMLGTSMRKTPSSPTTGVRQAVRKALRMVIRLGGKVFNSTEGVWMGFSSRCLWRCCLVVLHPRWCKISSIQQYFDINKHHRPFHQGTRTGVPLTVYLWYLAGVLGWNSWGWKNP